MENTLVLLKPDTVQRGLSGQIITRLERRGLKLVAIKMLRMDEDLAHRHYAAHVGKDFFPRLVEFITSGPIIAMVWQGDDAVEMVRNAMGATAPRSAAPGTIRGDLAVAVGRNLVHGSDSVESAAAEIDLFFSRGEILDYGREVDRWITET